MVFTYTGKKLPSATRKSFDSSSIPNHRITSGISARWGTLRTICSVASVSRSLSVDTPLARPSAKQMPPPTTKPATARAKLTWMLVHSSPETPRRQPAASTSLGAGTKRVETSPQDAPICQAAIRAVGTSQGVRRCKVMASSTGRRRPDRVAHDDRLGDEPERVELVGDGLLLRRDLRRDWLDAVAGPPDGPALGFEIDAGRFREHLRERVPVGVGPSTGLRQFLDHSFQNVGTRPREAGVGEVERTARHDFFDPGEGARPLVLLGEGKERAPDRPGVDAAADEGGRRIGRAEVNRGDVSV